MSQPPPAKRKRTQLSFAEKKEIVEYKKTHQKATQDEMAAHFAKESGKQLGRSTVSDILRDRTKWEIIPKDTESTLRQRTGRHDNLENALFLWFHDVRAKGAVISDEMLIEKGKKFGEDLYIQDFSYSRGWLQRFKKRHTISFHKSHGEADSANPVIVAEGRLQLKEDLKDYNPNDIYNMDETGLFYRLQPNSTLATGPISGKKKQKDRITVTLCTNATGTDKLKPLVIGKSARPRSFGKTFDPTIYVTYAFNKKAWMTTLIFRDWLKKFNRRMRLERRQVILLIDNATSHSSENLNLTNVTVKYLPPNTTAHIQPIDAGIIRTFKSYYRNLLIRHFLQCIEDNEEQTISLKQAITNVKEAWTSVKQSTIENCWRHVKILPSDETADIDNDPSDDLPLSELRRLLSQLPTKDRMEANDYINVDSSAETGDSLSDRSILQLVHKRKATDDPLSDYEERSTDIMSDDDDKPAEPTISRTEARKHLTHVIKFVEQNPAMQTNLDSLWKVMRSFDSYSGSTVQKTLYDFMK